MPHVLQTCSSRSWGGLEIQTLEVSTLLLRRGVRVTLAAPPGSRLASAALAAAVPFFPIGGEGYVHPAAVLRLSRFLRAERVDLLHAQHSRDLATIVPAMLLSGSRRPIVLSKRMGSYIRKKDLLHRFTHRYVSRVLSVSEVIRRNVLETLPVPPERVETLHDAIDTARFDPKRVDGSGVRKEFGFSQEEIVVGFVGRFSPGKGHEEFLRAAALLRTRHPELRLLVVGEPSHGEEEYAAEIRALAAGLGLDPIVRFAGFRTDIPALMAAFDCFAFPSHAESFGVVLIEAMAMEAGIVSTNCDGILDIMVNGETGLMVPPGDAEALARGLERLIAEPEFRRAMGTGARRRVLQLFDQERQIDRLQLIYEHLLA
jgi:glycosyltransferase involved in cell wall biosynthesis